jgi:cyclopropane fatty-acyl-phospholipid synthase-like methyltransferase
MAFEAGDACVFRSFSRQRFERVMALFLFNYLTRAQMTSVMRAARERLAPGGRFVFTVPHACFPNMRTSPSPFFFDTAGESRMVVTGAPAFKDARG